MTETIKNDSIEMEAYGLTEEYLHFVGEDGERTIARITAEHRERYEVVCPRGTTHARLKRGNFADGDRMYPTVGDFVVLDDNPLGDSLILETLPRRSHFSRREPGPGPLQEQAVAANFDYVCILTSLNQEFRLSRLERYLTVAWQSGAEPVIILTKADLVDEYGEAFQSVQRLAVGVQIFAVSALSGVGMDELRAYFKPGRTLVFLGSSGVGKSSLINALAGQDLMVVKEIREEDARGRHTTTHRQLLLLPGGLLAIDTPGMRELGMWAVEEGLESTFVDVEALIAECRFSDCQHGSEPGCAVRESIERGELTPARLRRFLAMRRESLYAENRTRALRERQQRNKQIAQHVKASRARRK